MRIDLHVHTQESDGSLSVEEIIKLAHARDVRILALTDHESTQGIAEAERLAEPLNIEILRGVELLTSYKGQEIHLLGYFRDVNNLVLQRRLKELREQRTALAYKMVEHLKKDGVSLDWQDVEKEVNSQGAVSKGHIMRAIYHRNHGQNQIDWPEIAAYFRPGGVAYLPYLEHSFHDAVDLIFECGGLPVVAHPGLQSNPEMIFKLLAYRPIGLEVYYGYWERQAALISYYSDIAAKHAILSTGGSDFHGPFGPIQLGQMDIPFEEVNRLKDYLANGR